MQNITDNIKDIVTKTKSLYKGLTQTNELLRKISQEKKSYHEKLNALKQLYDIQYKKLDMSNKEKEQLVKKIQELQEENNKMKIVEDEIKNLNIVLDKNLSNEEINRIIEQTNQILEENKDEESGQQGGKKKYHKKHYKKHYKKSHKKNNKRSHKKHHKQSHKKHHKKSYKNIHK